MLLDKVARVGDDQHLVVAAQRLTVRPYLCVQPLHRLLELDEERAAVQLEVALLAVAVAHVHAYRLAPVERAPLEVGVLLQHARRVAVDREPQPRLEGRRHLVQRPVPSVIVGEARHGGGGARQHRRPHERAARHRSKGSRHRHRDRGERLEQLEVAAPLGPRRWRPRRSPPPPQS
eukprot:7328082-Prymnesium_polylepis.2